MRVSAECCAIDAAGGADDDVVLDHHAPELRHPVVVALVVLGEAEAFGADHGTGLDDAAAADLTSPADDRIGVDDGVLAERRLALDDGPGEHDAARAQTGARADHGIGADGDRLGDGRGLVDHCARMDARPPFVAQIAIEVALQDLRLSQAHVLCRDHGDAGQLRSQSQGW